MQKYHLLTVCLHFEKCSFCIADLPADQLPAMLPQIFLHRMFYGPYCVSLAEVAGQLAAGEMREAESDAKEIPLQQGCLPEVGT